MNHHPLTLENESIRIEVWPTLGGKVSSLVDKADKHELLFDYPDELPESPQYDMSYPDSWYAGWDECFPAVAPSPYVGHPYNAINVPDHGELWGIPTVATPTRHGITCVWHGLRFAYRLTRQIELDGPSLIARYRVDNLAPFPFRFVWALHGLMGATAPVHLELPAATKMRLSHDHEGHEYNTPFAWPALADGSASFDSLESLPAKKGWKLFSADPIAGPAVIRYPTRSRSLEVRFASDDVTAYWGLWVNTGGWAGHRHFAVEPTTGRFDQIDKSIRDHSAATVAPLGTVQWTVTYELRA